MRILSKQWNGVAYIDIHGHDHISHRKELIYMGIRSSYIYIGMIKLMRTHIYVVTCDQNRGSKLIQLHIVESMAASRFIYTHGRNLEHQTRLRLYMCNQNSGSKLICIHIQSK